MSNSPPDAAPPAAPAKPPFPLSLVRWRSPIRGPWLTSVFGAALLVGIPIEFLTGLLSYAAYDPKLAGNDTTRHAIFGFYLFNWLSEPTWLYRLTQGIHVGLGLALTPVVLAKLWSVIPKLFAWPGLTSVAHALERASLVLLVGGAGFEFVTGIMNIDYDYGFHFSFYNGHFLGAWAFIAGFVIHTALKVPVMWRTLRARPLATELRTSLADTRPEPADESGLVSVDPAPATMSRRGALALVGGSSLAVVALTAGQTIGGVTRKAALLAPRGQSYGSGPNDFQVNRTAFSAGIRRAQIDLDVWRLQVVGAHSVTFTRAELLAMSKMDEVLPIACVEGWSTVQRWFGVRLIDLARLAGVEHPGDTVVQSLQRGGFGRVTLAASQARDERSMLALRVNGADLSLNHGFPARTIIPAAPGVHNTKWVSSIHFGPGAP
jgi:DMSO/TMAO reductase YedYZ molybdopterin-dependent catalytic subunit